MCKDCEDKKLPEGDRQENAEKPLHAVSSLATRDTQVKLLIALLCIGIAYFLLIDVVL